MAFHPVYIKPIHLYVTISLCKELRDAKTQHLYAVHLTNF